MAGQPAVLDPASGTAARSLFEPRDQAGASRQAALRLAREARALPKDERWLYLRTLRSAARQEGLAGLAKLELRGPTLPGSPVERLAIGDDPAWRVPAPEQGLRSEGRASRRGLPAFALTGLLVGMAVAAFLPASLSETLPGTSGNDREPLPAQPTAASGAGGAPTSRADSQESHPGAGAGSAVSRSHGSQTSAGSRDGSRRAPRDGRLVGGVSGRGNGQIGTVRIDRPMRLRWISDGASFAILSQAWRFHPRAATGSTVLTPGTYRRFAVRSTGTWTLKLDPARGS